MGNRWFSLASTAALLWASGGVAAHAEPGLTFSSKGIEYESAGGNIEATLGGRLHLDAASVDDGGLETEDEEVRRARLELSIRLYDDWRLRIDREFTGGGSWRNVWLRYDVSDALSVQAGNFIAPFSMEDVGSSNSSMFMERSLAQSLAPGFGVGVGASYEGRRYSIAGGYFGDALDIEDDAQAEKGEGFALRGTWSPFERRRNTLHFGVGYEHRELDGGIRQISSRAESALSPTILNTGNITNVETTTSYNLEAAYSFGPVLVQAQRITTEVERSIGPSLSFDGHYIQAGWIVTGERYRYGDASGVFQGPEPRHQWGALELAARVSALDLTEVGASGGEAQDTTFGVNWYLGQNVRVLANYVHSEVDAVNPLDDRDVDVVQGRLQFDF